MYLLNQEFFLEYKMHKILYDFEIKKGRLNIGQMIIQGVNELGGERVTERQTERKLGERESGGERKCWAGRERGISFIRFCLPVDIRMKMK